MRTAEHELALAIAKKWLNTTGASMIDFGGQECVMARQLIRATERTENLRAALEESVKLQSHYAGLLNMHDDGKRMIFRNADEWVWRLMGLDLIPNPSLTK
jgi:hypothetical protein